jgi:hypothetical protein
MIKKIKCNQCNHQWAPRTGKPVECPNCKSRKWDKPPVRSRSVVGQCDGCHRIKKVKRYGHDREYAYCDDCVEEIKRGN